MEPLHIAYEQAKTFTFPEAITLKILLTGSQTDGAIAVFEDIVEPGVGPGRHIHHHQDETFLFLEGNFDVEIDGKLHHMMPGDVGFVPKGTIHAFKNVGNSKGRVRYIFSPALTIEKMFESFYESLQEGDLTEAKMSEIAAKHGQEFVGPPI